jgi:hypothetical protein
MGLLITQTSPIPCYQIPLRLQYLPQHPLLKHIQPIYHWFITPNLTLWLAILAVLEVTYLCPSSSEKKPWLTIKLQFSRGVLVHVHRNVCCPSFIFTVEETQNSRGCLYDSVTPNRAQNHESFQIKKATCSWRHQLSKTSVTVYVSSQLVRMSISAGDCLVHRWTRQLPVESDDTRGRIYTIKKWTSWRWAGYARNM